MAGSLYHPLPSPNHIRVLELHDPSPGDKRSGLVECGLRLLNLSDPDTEACYDALSYTWQSEPGEPDGLATITCAGYEMRVGGNLHEALVHLCRTPGVKFLWADAICINQDDLQERAEQVRLMGNVFHKAHRVHCWLGVGNEKSKSALRNIERLGRAFREQLPDKDDKSEPEVRPRFNDSAFFDRIGQASLTNTEWYDIGRLFGRSWFSRAWTFQEFSLATSSTFWVRGQACQGIDLAALVSYVGTMGWASPMHERCGSVSVRGFGALIATDTLRIWQEDRSIAQHAIPKLLEQGIRMYGNQALTVAALSGYLVETCRGRKATDPRDCVFAPLAMLVVYLAVIEPDVAPPEPTIPDYNTTAGHIYVDFTRWLIKGTRSLTILGKAERDVHHDEAATTAALGQKLPSWTPDYSRPAKRSLMLSRSRTALDPVASAPEWDACRGEPLTFSFVDPERRLHLKGYPLRTILAAHPALLNPGYCVPNLLALAEEVYGGREDVDWVEELARVLAGSSPMIPTDREEFRTQFGIVMAIDSTMSAIFEKLFYGSVERQSDSQVEAEGLRIVRRAEQTTFWSARGDLRHWFEQYSRALDAVNTNDPIALHSNAALMSIQQRMATYWIEAISQCKLRSVVATGDGCLGLAPDTCRPGDEIWLLPGLYAPMVLRPLSNGNYQVVGEAYVHGNMMGEAFGDEGLVVGETVAVVLE